MWAPKNCGPGCCDIPLSAALHETYWSRIGNNVHKLLQLLWDFVPQAHYRSFALGPLGSENVNVCRRHVLYRQCCIITTSSDKLSWFHAFSDWCKVQQGIHGHQTPPRYRNSRPVKTLKSTYDGSFVTSWRSCYRKYRHAFKVTVMHFSHPDLKGHQ